MPIQLRTIMNNYPRLRRTVNWLVGQIRDINVTTSIVSTGVINVTNDNVEEVFSEPIDSTKLYFLKENIILTDKNITITIPSTGLYISGYNFDLSGITCGDDNHTLFDSASSGNVLFTDFFINMSGANSRVYNLISNTGNEAIEINRVNYINCTSLGILDNFRQGLESGTGRFGGTPELELRGVWLGGFIFQTTIVRSLIDGAYTLFKAGVGFLMSSRFKTNLNVDLPASVSLLDFAPANFVNPSTLQIQDSEVTRNGVYNPEDTNITPNINKADLISIWVNNNGISNTFIGGLKDISVEVETVISAVNTPTVVLGTWVNSDLQHFDVNLTYSLRHLGTDPRNFRITFDFVMEGAPGEQYSLHMMKDSGGVITTEYSQTRTIDRLQGTRDVTYFNGTFGVLLEQNDFLYWEVENITTGSNCTLELDSQWFVEAR